MHCVTTRTRWEELIVVDLLSDCRRFEKSWVLYFKHGIEAIECIGASYLEYQLTGLHKVCTRQIFLTLIIYHGPILPWISYLFVTFIARLILAQPEPRPVTRHVPKLQKTSVNPSLKQPHCETASLPMASQLYLSQWPRDFRLLDVDVAAGHRGEKALWMFCSAYWIVSTKNMDRASCDSRKWKCIL